MRDDMSAVEFLPDTVLKNARIDSEVGASGGNRSRIDGHSRRSKRKKDNFSMNRLEASAAIFVSRHTETLRKQVGCNQLSIQRDTRYDYGSLSEHRLLQTVFCWP